MTLRRGLCCLSVVRATIWAAVPEHSICTAGTCRNSARPCSSDAPVGSKSSHFRGSPAVGGISRTGMFGFGQTQAYDAYHDAQAAGDLHERQVFAEIQH